MAAEARAPRPAQVRCVVWGLAGQQQNCRIPGEAAEALSGGVFAAAREQPCLLGCHGAARPDRLPRRWQGGFWRGRWGTCFRRSLGRCGTPLSRSRLRGAAKTDAAPRVALARARSGTAGLRCAPRSSLCASRLAPTRRRRPPGKVACWPGASHLPGAGGAAAACSPPRRRVPRSGGTAGEGAYRASPSVGGRGLL